MMRIFILTIVSHNSIKIYFSKLENLLVIQDTNLCKYSVDFFEYDFVETNIVKLNITNLGTPIILLCIFRSPSTDINVFNDTVIKVITENKKKVFTPCLSRI